MMTDKELLELAAKAAGIKIDRTTTNGGGLNNTGFDIIGNAVLDWHNGVTWNPLTDDGDALRLAVKLHLDLDFEDYGCCANNKCIENTTMGYGLEEATRRAIVRAAAEIGRTNHSHPNTSQAESQDLRR